MGSQGMKRKGRRHLPKVGTRPDEERVFEQSRRDIVNFGRHRPWHGPARAIGVVIAVAAVLALVAFFALT